MKPPAAKLFTLNVHGEPFRGDAKARVAIVEYSDFDCSFCGKYVKEIYPSIDLNYIKTGKLKYFFRDFPGPKETISMQKAQAARCAGEQGKFWEMHDLLFKLSGNPTGDEWLAHAGSLRLNTNQFQVCVASGKYVENIQRSVASAERMGIHGTPAFLLGTLSEEGDFVRATRTLIGAESFESIKAALDELLESTAQEK